MTTNIVNYIAFLAMSLPLFCNNIKPTQDEVNCSQIVTPCARGYFRCANRRCVRGSFVCDGDNDCGDGSDESSCGRAVPHSPFMAPVCSSGHFICGNRKCVDRNNVCDSTDDCGDNTDEASCGTYHSEMCGTGQFECENHACILSSELCNSVDDCGDFSDESGCLSGFSGVTSTNTSLASLRCQEGHLLCANGRRCFSIDVDLCDGLDDCGDYSDEDPTRCASCPTDKFHCNNNRCISASWMCDGDDDCQDGSDENRTMCSRCHISDNLWQCKTSKNCVYVGLLCRSFPSVCGNNDDSGDSPEACRVAFEHKQKSAACPQGTLKCKDSDLCIAYQQLCDGKVDCCPEDPKTTLLRLLGSELAPHNNETHVEECEKTDELGCNLENKCSVNNGGCSNICIDVAVPPRPTLCSGMSPEATASYCTCPSGFSQPFSNLSSCRDIDECQSPLLHKCSHVCTNSIGSYTCSCLAGFTKSDTYCEPIGNPNSSLPEFLYIQADMVRLRTGNKVEVVYHSELDKPITSVDVDIRKGVAYFAVSDGLKSALMSRGTKKIKSQQPPLVDLHDSNDLPGTTVDLAVDFIGNNLYIIQRDKVLSKIMVSLTDGRYRKTLLSSAVGITSLAVNPLNGKMYYATYESSDGFSLYGYVTSFSFSAVVMASMAGGRESHVEIFHSNNPNPIQTIIVDWLGNGRVYFSHGLNVMVANLDGSDSSLLGQPLRPQGHRAFDVFGNSLFGFYGSQSMSQLFQIDKFSRFLGRNLTGYLGSPFSLRVYDPLKAGLTANWPDPCKQSNCSHLCLLKPNGDNTITSTCACPDGGGSDRQQCKASEVTLPEHPSACFEKCEQGICVRDRQTKKFECLCNKRFSGTFCNVSAENYAIPISGKSTSSPGRKENIKSALIAIAVVAIVLLVLCICAAILIFICWRRRQAALAPGFNMTTLQEQHD